MDKNKLKLSGILVGILFPVLAATAFFMWQEGTGFGGTTNKGQLIIPVIDVTAFGMQNNEGEPIFLPFEESVEGIELSDYDPRPWSLIYLGNAECEESCMERLNFLRSVHIRLGAEVDRVARFYLNSDAPMPAELKSTLKESFPDMTITASSVDMTTLLEATHPAGIDPEELHYIYVVDPVGNVMLYFTPENGPEEILSDVSKLLKRSSLG